MIHHYYRLPIGWRLLLWGGLMVAMLLYGYYADYAKVILDIKKQNLLKHRDQQKLSDLEKVIKQKDQLSKEYEELQQLFAQETLSSWFDKLIPKQLTIAWHPLSNQQIQLEVQGSWQDLNLFWEKLNSTLMPWQLEGCELSHVVSSNQLKLILFLSHLAKDSNINKNASKELNPFEQHNLDDEVTLQELAWFGALKTNGIFTAYAVLPNGNVTLFQRGSVVQGQMGQSWKVTALDLQHIVFEDATHHLYPIYYRQTVPAT